jgi:hypothetical protein
LELSVSWIVALLGRNGLPLLRSEEGASSWSLKCHTFCCFPLQLLNIPVSHVFANTILYNADGSYAGFDPAEFPSRSGGKAEAVKHIKKVCRTPAAAAPLSRPPPYCHAALCIFFKLPAASLPPWAVSGEKNCVRRPAPATCPYLGLLLTTTSRLALLVLADPQLPDRHHGW